MVCRSCRASTKPLGCGDQDARPVGRRRLVDRQAGPACVHVSTRGWGHLLSVHRDEPAVECPSYAILEHRTGMKLETTHLHGRGSQAKVVVGEGGGLNLQTSVFRGTVPSWK